MAVAQFAVASMARLGVNQDCHFFYFVECD